MAFSDEDKILIKSCMIQKCTTESSEKGLNKSGLSHCIYQRQIHSANELKRQLTDVWCGLEQSNFDEAIDHQ